MRVEAVQVFSPWERGTSTGTGTNHRRPLDVPMDKGMTATPNSSRILRLLRRSPRSTDATPTPARTPLGNDNSIPPREREKKESPRFALLLTVFCLRPFFFADVDVPEFPGGVVLQPIKADVKLGAFEMAIAVFKEAASLASKVPYMGAIAGIFLQIIKIKEVRFFFLFLCGSTMVRSIVIASFFFFFF